MKIRNLSSVLLLLISVAAFAQEILIPYKSGEKYGLCDEKGRVVLQPAYDKVDFLKKDYFIFGTKQMGIDTTIDWRGDTSIYEKANWSLGLLKKDKVLIPEQELKGFFVYERFILVSEEKSWPENSFLYNLNGEKVYDEKIFYFNPSDTNALGSLAAPNSQFSFLFLFHFNVAANEGPKYSIAIYDNELQKIESWLVKDVTAYRYHPNLSLPDLTYCSYVDDSGILQEKYIRLVNHRLELLEKSALRPDERIRLQELEQEQEYVETRTWKLRPKIIEEQVERVPKVEPVYDGYCYKRDTLYHLQTGRVKLLENTELIVFMGPSRCHVGPILYKKDRKYGLLIKGEYSRILYDSLLYAGSHFIAGNKKGNKMYFGFVDQAGHVVVPLKYDSIYGKMKQWGLEYTFTPAGRRSSICLQEKYSNALIIKPYSTGSHEHGNLVFRRGKCGFISRFGTTILPIEYDTIAYNSIGIGTDYWRLCSRDNFIVKKDGLYGGVDLNMDWEVGDIVSKATPVIFPFVPANYIYDYYGIPGFRLYGLYDELSGEFKGFANENGVLYFKEE